MNKNAIKKFAIDARKKLIASVTDKAGMFGITPDNCSGAVTKGADFEVYKTTAGTEVTLNRKQCEQRRKLVDQINSRGFEAVIEEVAYTWFNRICAIRFMEVNDYMYPVRVRVLSSEKEGKNEPDILTMAPDIDWDFTDKEREYIIEAKMNNKLDDLFKMLFIKQCNLLHEVLPGLFEETEDYTEMLLNISFTNEDDVVRMLIDGVDEKDFNVNTLDENGNPTGQVEIIGWLYQYYNTELKDDTFAKLKKNVKISKERIPAATQLFTPDWIVRYMVENSVGRIWIEHLRAIDPSVDEKAAAEKFGWKYYLPEAEQEEEVNVKLAEIRKSYKELKPEDITCIDPCMGSGHILIAMFDVLMDIYESAGYDKREAAFSIVENNIYGLDIDKRAYQLAYFAVMMKGRGYNRKFFKGNNVSKMQPNIHFIIESNDIVLNHIKYMGAGLVTIEKNKAETQIKELIDTFKNAREFGSIIEVPRFDFDLLGKYVEKTNEDSQVNIESIGLFDTQKFLYKLIELAKVMERKYSAVVTNPPYMGSSSMSTLLSDYTKKYYPEGKLDLFAVFIQKCQRMTTINGFIAMITQHSWMFLTSYGKLRKEIANNTYVNLVHLGTRAFDEIGGEVVQTASFVLRKNKINKYKSIFQRLVNYSGEAEKQRAFFEEENIYINEQEKFVRLPGEIIAYWVSNELIDDFDEGTSLGEIAYPRQGMATTNNNRFLRLWFELDKNKIDFTAKSENDTEKDKKWFPYNKGGEFRKWYGNNDYVVNFYNHGKEICDYIDSHSAVDHKGRVINREKYFKPSVTWSKVSGGSIAFRYKPEGHIFDVAGTSIFGNEEMLYTLMGLLNSAVAMKILECLSPTLNYEVGHISSIPVLNVGEYKDEIINIVKQNIKLSKEDWDSYETSWDFEIHPLLKYGVNSLEQAYTMWSYETTERFEKLKENEQRLNEIFSKIYKIEVNKTIDEEYVSVKKGNLYSDIRSLLSYLVGCIFGRYSFMEKGIVYAGGIWEPNNYSSYMPDKDNCIPITDEEYFQDDIVSKIIELLRLIFGEEKIEENLSFVAKALGIKGKSPIEVIRKYFIDEFYSDHIKMYQKKPIYWMFNSGKNNGFKCLVYIHRFSDELLGRVRLEYLHKCQKFIENALQSAQYTKDSSLNNNDKSKATKDIDRYTKQLAEISLYDMALSHVINQKYKFDLDNGVKDNYELFQNIEISQEGKKNIKINLLSKM